MVSQTPNMDAMKVSRIVPDVAEAVFHDVETVLRIQVFAKVWGHSQPDIGRIHFNWLDWRIENRIGREIGEGTHAGLRSVIRIAVRECSLNGDLHGCGRNG